MRTCARGSDSRSYTSNVDLWAGTNKKEEFIWSVGFDVKKRRTHLESMRIFTLFRREPYAATSLFSTKIAVRSLVETGPVDRLFIHSVSHSTNINRWLLFSARYCVLDR